MKMGIQIIHEGMSHDQITQTVLDTECLGFDCVWFGDHFWFTSPEKSFLECWTLLSMIASKTDKIRLGPLVLNHNYWSFPEKLAHMASTLDVISNGRLNLGLGAGWHKKEFETFNMPFPKAKERIRNLSMNLEKMKTSFPFFKSTQLPHPPLWIGGYGDYMLKVVAKHADASNFERFDLSPIKCKERLEYLDKQCKKQGRSLREKSLCVTIDFGGAEEEQKMPLKNYLTMDYMRKAWRNPSTALRFIGRKIGVNKSATFLQGSPEKVLERLKEYTAVGITYFIIRFIDIHNLKTLATEVYPEVKKW